jgi:phosphoribosylaminoimidazole-succinocarboxamide synthase
MELLSQGKVRDIYAVDDERLLMVSSDRVSTYDVVHPNPIPDRGKVLTGLSVFWFGRTEQIVPNRLRDWRSRSSSRSRSSRRPRRPTSATTTRTSTSSARRRSWAIPNSWRS